MLLRKIIYSIRHSRAGGNPGLFSAELAWIPAFEAMTARSDWRCWPDRRLRSIYDGDHEGFGSSLFRTSCSSWWKRIFQTIW